MSANGLKRSRMAALVGQVPPRLVYYGLLLLAGVLLFAPANFLPPLNPSTPILAACEYTALCASSRTPWGVVTSIFMFDGWDNVGVFVELAAVFMVSNFVFSPQETRRRCSFAVASMYVSGIVPNALFLALRPGVQFFGPSGVIYGFLGVTLALSIFNIFPPGLRRGGGITLTAYYQNMRNFGLAVLNLFVFVSLFGFLVVNTSLFLGAGPNVDVFAHGLGFLLGLASGYLYWYLTQVRRWRVTTA